MRLPLYFRWLSSWRFLWNVDTYLSERRHIYADNSLNILHCDNLKLYAFSFVLESPYRLWPTHFSSAQSVVNDSIWNLIRRTPHKLRVYTMAYLCVFQEQGQNPSRRLLTVAALLWSLFYRLFYHWKCLSCLMVLNTVYQRSFHIEPYSNSAFNCKNFLL